MSRFHSLLRNVAQVRKYGINRSKAGIGERSGVEEWYTQEVEVCRVESSAG